MVREAAAYNVYTTMSLQRPVPSGSYLAIVVYHGGHRWFTDGGSNVLNNTGGEGGSGLQRIHPHVSAEAVYPLDHTWLLWCTTAGTAGLRMEAQMY